MQAAVTRGTATIQVRMAPRARGAGAVAAPATAGAVPAGVPLPLADLPLPLSSTIEVAEEAGRQTHVRPPHAPARDVLIRAPMWTGASKEAPVNGTRLTPTTTSIRVAAALP